MGRASHVFQARNTIHILHGVGNDDDGDSMPVFKSFTLDRVKAVEENPGLFGGHGRHESVKVIKDKCTSCYGEGIVSGEETIELKIPAGVYEGMQLSMDGKGNAARHGGINGDLLIAIQEVEHPELKRDGIDLIYNLYIGIPDAILGCSAEIPTIGNKVKIKVEPGTQSGKILRLKGKGLPDINGYGHGDLLVRINVFIPHDVSKEDKKLLEQMRESESFNPQSKRNESFFSKLKNMFRC